MIPPVVSPWLPGGAPAAPAPYVGALPSVPSYWYALSAASSAASAYHGYRRNAARSPIPWAIVWGLLGAAFPVITPAIGVAQGFGKRK